MTPTDSNLLALNSTDALARTASTVRSARPMGQLPLRAVLRRLMDLYNLRESELARSAGLPQTTVNRLLLHPTSDPRINTLIPIAEHLGVTLGQLVGIEPLTPTIGCVEKALQPHFIPYLPWSMIAQWMRCRTENILDMSQTWVVTEKSVSPKAFCVVAMPFMEPRFRAGSQLVVDPGAQPMDGSYVIVMLQDTACTVRKVINDGSGIVFRSFDPNAPLLPMNAGHQIVGTIVEARETCT